jgi:Flp pilus assembly protein TadG
MRKISYFDDNEGTAIIEFALVLPVLILLLFGIIEFSILLYDKAMITNASREGARAGIVYDYDPDNNVNHPQDGVILTVVNQYCQNHLISFDESSAVATTIERTGDESGDILTVTVSYQYGYLILPNFAAALTGGVNLGAETVMRME